MELKEATEKIMPFTKSDEIVNCSSSSCYNKTARYFIECKNNFTESIYAGQCCEDCLPKAIKNDFKIVGYIVYPVAIEKTLPERKNNADFGNPSGIFDMKSLMEEGS